MERQIAKAILAAVTFVAAALHCVPALADDYGPHPDLRAIRHDLPIIFSGDQAERSTDIVVLGNDALAQMNVGGTQEIEILRRRYDRWWLEHIVYIERDTCETFGPTVSFLESVGVGEPLASVASQHLSLVRRAMIPRSSPVPGGLGGGGPMCWHSDDPAPRLNFSPIKAGFGGAMFEDGYVARVGFVSSDAPEDARIVDARGRMPSEAESWMTRGGNSYYFFSATVESTRPINVQAGTTIDVWFPFALRPEKKYSLTIGYTDVPIGPIEGTLKDNMLHFVLPTFSVKPGARLMAEIEGNPDGP